MYRILIVEDDSGIAEGIRARLEKWHFEVHAVTDFRGVMTAFSEVQPHLVLLDVCLPCYDGYYWINEIRRVSDVPVLFISSAADNMNIVMAMNMGADDFIAKPFDGSVLVAKIQAMLRRAYDFGASAAVLEHRGALLDMNAGTVTVGENKLPLTRNEYRILLTLMQEKGRTVSRERLMQALWETDSFVDDNTLTVNVNRLRKKLDAAGLNGFIETRVGEGYRIG